MNATAVIQLISAASTSFGIPDHEPKQVRVWVEQVGHESFTDASWLNVGLVDLDLAYSKALEQFPLMGSGISATCEESAAIVGRD